MKQGIFSSEQEVLSGAFSLDKDAPLGRVVQRQGAIVAVPILSALHPRYARILFCRMMSIAAGAAATVEISRIEYEGKCATCHGVTGKGDDEQAACGVIKESDSLEAFEHRHLAYE